MLARKEYEYLVILYIRVNLLVLVLLYLLD